MLPQKAIIKTFHVTKTLHKIVLIHLTSNVAFKTRKLLQMAGFKNRKNAKFRLTRSLPHSLPDHICKPKHQTKHRTATILCHSNKLTSEICLLGFQRVWGLCASLFLLPSIRLFFFFMHINVPINTFLEQCI